MPSAARYFTFSVSLALMGSLFPMPSVAQIQNPLKAAKDAYNKARQEQQQKQSQPQAQPQPRTQGRPASTEAELASGTPDFSKMPDVIGVRIGMDPQEAVDILKRQYPKDLYQAMPIRNIGLWNISQPVNTGYNVLMPNNAGTPDVYLSLTAPPDRQVVWKIVRYTRGMHINRSTLLTALREKYGKESAAYTADQGKPSTDDRVTTDLLWLFDERGARVPLPPAEQVANTFSPLYSCRLDATTGTLGNPQPQMPANEATLRELFPAWCSTLVGVHIHIGGDADIVETTVTEMLDVPLAVRTARTSTAWQRQMAEKARKDDVEKSKTVKPVF
jgi:hypothetical protein